jgi:hypothetical protein
MGFRIAFYTNSIFSSDICDFRPTMQYSLRSLSYSCFLFVDMCLRQVSFRSRCIPRYFTSSGCVNCLLFSWTGGHVFFFKEKVTWTDLFHLPSYAIFSAIVGFRYQHENQISHLHGRSMSFLCNRNGPLTRFFTSGKGVDVLKLKRM